MENIVSVLLGLLFAWLILSFTSVGRSNYANTILYPASVMEPPAQNSALIGAGLASAAKPSVMDATPASSAQPVMMGAMNMAPISVTPGAPQMPMPVQRATSQMPMAMPMQGSAQMPMPTPMAMPMPMPPQMPMPTPMPMPPQMPMPMQGAAPAMR